MQIRPGLHVIVDAEFRVQEIELDDTASKIVRAEVKAEPGKQVQAVVIASHLVSGHRSSGRHCALVLDGPAFFEALRAIEQVKSGQAPAVDPDAGLPPRVDVRDIVKTLGKQCSACGGEGEYQWGGGRCGRCHGSGRVPG